MPVELVEELKERLICEDEIAMAERFLGEERCPPADVAYLLPDCRLSDINAVIIIKRTSTAIRAAI